MIEGFSVACPIFRDTTDTVSAGYPSHSGNNIYDHRCRCNVTNIYVLPSVGGAGSEVLARCRISSKALKFTRTGQYF